MNQLKRVKIPFYFKVKIVSLYKYILLLPLFLLLFSCTNYKNIAYFNDISDSIDVYKSGKVIGESTYEPIVIKPNDALRIFISTLTPKADGSLNISNGDIDASVGSNENNLLSNDKSELNAFIVDKDGNIELAILGKIHVAGLTTDEIQKIILKEAKIVFKNPVVSVRLENFKITVLGEVNKPGSYIVNSEKFSVLDAIGLANDLTIYGKRENVMLVRQVNNSSKKIIRLNLNNSKLISSPYFYLKQGDVIYVEPSKSKAAATDLASTKFYTILASALSLIIVIATRVNF